MLSQVYSSSSTADAERLVHPTAPADQINDLPSNFLHIPSIGRHNRSQSTSSIGSCTSNWTENPCPTPASDIGDPQIDLQRLLVIDGQKDSHADSPFAFGVNQLAKLHDPKDLNVLRAMGGLKGLCLGLRTDVSKGLSRDESILDGHITIEDVQRMLETQMTPVIQNHDQDDPPAAGLLKRRTTLLSLNFSRGPRSFQDRIKVFGENRIPIRKAKNIFQLMWMVLQDKILVS
jgi:P-type Ca2+ transporter type 2C